MKYKEIPFNMTLAKRISDGSVNGRILVIGKDENVVGNAKYLRQYGAEYEFSMVIYTGTEEVCKDIQVFDEHGVGGGDFNKLVIEIPVDDSTPENNLWTQDETLTALHELIRNGIWKNRCFESICCELIDLHERKNEDYGGAFNKSMLKFGVVALMVRLSDKWERLESLFKNGKPKVTDESFEDTLMDLAAYAIMGVEYLYNIKNIKQ